MVRMDVAGFVVAIGAGVVGVARVMGVPGIAWAVSGCRCAAVVGVGVVGVRVVVGCCCCGWCRLCVFSWLMCVCVCV